MVNTAGRNIEKAWSAMQQLRQIELTTEMRGRAKTYMKYAVALGLAKGRPADAVQIFKSRYPNSLYGGDIAKAAVPVGTHIGPELGRAAGTAAAIFGRAN